MMRLRPYQSRAIEAVERYLSNSTGNPLVEMPTASGKTVVFATMLQRWLANWPESRFLILAHQRELLTQAADKLRKIWPEAPIGFYCSGLGKKDGTQAVTIGSIQTIYQQAPKLDPFDVVIVDEAHLIPLEGFGRYRRFLDEARLQNPRLRVVGFTATPYRLSGGYIVDSQSDDHMFDFVAYSANVRQMIEDGYLCPLTSKATDAAIDTDGLRTRNGDWVESDLQGRADTDELVEAACRELCTLAHDRHSWLIFCCGIDHAEHVAACLRRFGIDCGTVTGKTPARERERILADFDAGRLRAVTNMNVLTTGLDVTRIDCIALMRPTQSTSLYVQMVGRGFRLDSSKANTLVLDFAGNVSRHGPIDAIDMKPGVGGRQGPTPTKRCPGCREIILLSARECPGCGLEFPPPERGGPNHDARASSESILSVDGSRHYDGDITVTVNRHRKPGKPDSIRVVYFFEGKRVSEWVCLDHGGLAGRMAQRWWTRRFGEPPPTVDEALADLFLHVKIAAATRSIQYRKAGKYFEIVNIDTTSTDAPKHAFAS